MGEIKIRTTVKDFSSLKKTFEAVKINLSLKNADGSIISLPILPKIKDDKGNVYCELDDDGERILKEYVGLQD
ncbi:hypothetical protein J7E63_11480 [Bacillus sp. ISL-75]|uniref:hypothetical protein n=1 Tax=Bacillus sp. ISL-75 TaxID=2819137 RepID=UPI001BE66179|nr:hypothetical protein [Bacillus sp. ISL-75]MBT2727554.1 hypothetical protein [Bacillus sp. ISL-75]